jgi:lactate dehydrogenase-like 2-hydroxyacid dehydrogenase
MKVFVFDPLWPQLNSAAHKDQLKHVGIELSVTTEADKLNANSDLFSDQSPKILAVNPDYVNWSLPSSVFKDIPNLKCIITQSTSYGWIDTDYAKSHDIAVCNIRNFSTDAVADWAVMMMLNVARKIPLLIKAKFPLNFTGDFSTYQGINLKGKTAGIIGLGNIGQAIGERCHGLGMNVIYWNRSPRNNPWKKSDLPDLFKVSDVIFPCMADTEETHHIMTDDLLKSMKPSAIMASIVHKYYNHDLVLDMVKSGRFYGYGFEADPSSFDKYDGNVWAAPAYGWCTNGSMEKAMNLFVDAIINAAAQKYPTRVN